MSMLGFSRHNVGDGACRSYCLAYFKLTTDEGEAFEVGKLTDEASHSFSGASGVLVGFAGQAGSVIDALEPLFLKRITNYYDNFILGKS